LDRITDATRIAASG
jgi:two-component system sensor histidine kinase VanS